MMKISVEPFCRTRASGRTNSAKSNSSDELSAVGFSGDSAVEVEPLQLAGNGFWWPSRPEENKQVRF